MAPRGRGVSACGPASLGLSRRCGCSGPPRAALAEFGRLGSWEVEPLGNGFLDVAQEASRRWCPRCLLGEKRRMCGTSPVCHCCKDSADCFFLLPGLCALLSPRWDQPNSLLQIPRSLTPSCASLLHSCFGSFGDCLFAVKDTWSYHFEDTHPLLNFLSEWCGHYL